VARAPPNGDRDDWTCGEDDDDEAVAFLFDCEYTGDSSILDIDGNAGAEERVRAATGGVPLATRVDRGKISEVRLN
jgi:hypothetical protein